MNVALANDVTIGGNDDYPRYGKCGEGRTDRIQDDEGSPVGGDP